MKTIYLKENTYQELIDKIKSILPEYNGEVEYSKNGIHVHYIGDVMISRGKISENGQITPPTYSGAFHANMLVPDDIKIESIKPNNPIHTFYEL